MIQPRRPLRAARQGRVSQARVIRIRTAARNWARGSRRLKRIPYPRAQEDLYAKELVRWTRQICAQVRAALEPVLQAEYRADAGADSTIGRLRGQLADTPLPSVDSRFQRLESLTRVQANDQLGVVTGGVPLWTGQSERTKQLLAETVSENVRLISSIPQQLLDQVEVVLRQGLIDGTHLEGMRDALQERFGVAESRAELIARDQIGKANGQLAEARSRDLGIETYVWRVTGGSGGDGRVRPMHLDLEGTAQRYDDPPVTNEEGDQNNPGEDIQCRCTGEADAEALLEILLSQEGPPASEDQPEYTPEDRAQGGLADADLEYLREGMRDLSPHLAGYEGVTAREIDAIAAGERATANSVSAFEPIRLESGPTASGRAFELVDGRHRLAAARQVGARRIVATVDGKRVVIPVPRL